MVLFYVFIRLDSSREQAGKHWVERGGGIGKGPRDGNRTRVAVSTVALYDGALTTRPLAPTVMGTFYLSTCQSPYFTLT